MVTVDKDSPPVEEMWIIIDIIGTGETGVILWIKEEDQDKDIIIGWIIGEYSRKVRLEEDSIIIVRQVILWDPQAEIKVLTKSRQKIKLVLVICDWFDCYYLFIFNYHFLFLIMINYY